MRTLVTRGFKGSATKSQWVYSSLEFHLNSVNIKFQTEMNKRGGIIDYNNDSNVTFRFACITNAYRENREDFWCKEQLFIYILNQAAMFDIQVMAAFQEIILSSNFN